MGRGGGCAGGGRGIKLEPSYETYINYGRKCTFSGPLFFCSPCHFDVHIIGCICLGGGGGGERNRLTEEAG